MTRHRGYRTCGSSHSCTTRACFPTLPMRQPSDAFWNRSSSFSQGCRRHHCRLGRRSPDASSVEQGQAPCGAQDAQGIAGDHLIRPCAAPPWGRAGPSAHARAPWPALGHGLAGPGDAGRPGHLGGAGEQGGLVSHGQLRCGRDPSRHQAAAIPAVTTASGRALARRSTTRRSRSRGGCRRRPLPRLPCLPWPPNLRPSFRLWLRSLPVWPGAEGGELPQPGPFQGRLGSRNARTLPRHHHPKRPRLDGATHRRRQHDRLTVDADRDLGGIGGDGDLIGGAHGQSPAVPTAHQLDRLTGAIHPDGDHAPGSGIQPGTPTQAGDVAHLIGVVADQQGLRFPDPGLTGPGGQPGAAVALGSSGRTCKVVPRLSSR